MEPANSSVPTRYEQTPQRCSENVFKIVLLYWVDKFIMIINFKKKQLFWNYVYTKITLFQKIIKKRSSYWTFFEQKPNRFANEMLICPFKIHRF